MSIQAVLVDIEEITMSARTKEQMQELVGKANKFKTLRNPKIDEGEKIVKNSSTKT